MIKDINSDIKFDLRDDVITDEIVVREIWEENVYEVKNYMFVNEDGSPKTVIDIGANIGAFSIYCAYYGANVIAIEPEPHNLKALKNNIEINSLNTVSVIESGVSDYIGFATISNEGGGSTILDGKDGAKISVTTLDNIVKDIQDNISVLKIDVEGSEVEIILGASYDTINKFDYISIEFDVRTGKRLGDMVMKLSESHHVRTMGSWERGGMMFAWRY